MRTRDYYHILGVAPESEDVVIQAAYRALMRRYHPDTNKSAEAAKRAVEINEAYEVLRDPGRRRQYDAARAAAADASKQNSAPPPPPPPPPQQSGDPSTQPPPRVPWDDRGTRIVAGLIGAFVLIVTVGALSESGSSAVDNNMAVENLEAGNLIVEDDMNAMDMSESVPDAAPPAPATLATLAQAPVQYDDIESAAARFAKTLTSTGMSGARRLSEKCHAGVTAQPTWAAADWCAAFDYAAAHVDAEVGKSAGWPANPYFQFQAENQADRYKEAGAADYFVSTRLTSIRQAAESAADDAVMQEVVKLKTQSAPTPPAESDTPERSPSSSDEDHSLTQRWLDNVLNSQSANRVGGNG